jgi:hypothetical protein
MKKLLLLIALLFTAATFNGADFNNDGRPDLLLLNKYSRQTAVWYMNNNVQIGGAFGPTIPAGWRIVTAIDFNRDQHPDFLAYNATTRQTAVLFLNGMTGIGIGWGPLLPAGWTLVAAADYDGDSSIDFVLFNPTTRQTAIWYMTTCVNSGQVFNPALISGAMGPTLPVGYFIVTVDDFNRDGHPDYLLFNSGTGKTAIWYMNGATLVAGAYGPTLPNGYSALETGDYNGDGYPDMVVDGAASVVYLNNNIPTGAAFVHPVIPPAYELSSASDDACQKSISPTSLVLNTTNGGTFQIQVLTSNQNCVWETAHSSDWPMITVTSGGSGRGNSVVTFTVSNNTDVNPRNGSIDVAGFTFAVHQAGTFNGMFEGNWYGTYTRPWTSPSGCTMTTNTGVGVSIAVEGAVVYNGAQASYIDGLPCFDASCNLLSYAYTTGNIGGGVSGNVISFTYNGSAQGGDCAGDTISITYNGTLAANGTLQLTDQAGYQITLYRVQ